MLCVFLSDTRKEGGMSSETYLHHFNVMHHNDPTVRDAFRAVVRSTELRRRLGLRKVGIVVRPRDQPIV